MKSVSQFEIIKCLNMCIYLLVFENGGGMEIKRKLKKFAGKARKAFVKFLDVMSDNRILIALILTFSFSIAILIRITPMRWGVYLNEFDPYYEYYLAERIIEKSDGNIFKGIAWWFNWWFEPSPKPKDTLFWAPYGRDLRRSSQPGSAIFSAIIYYILNNLFGFPVSLYEIHAFLPAIAASFATFAMFLVGRKLKDDNLGIFSAFFISISFPFIYRTNLGAKHEGIAIPAILFGLYAFLKSYREEKMSWAIIAGLSYGIVALAWGGYIYIWELLSLLIVIWLLLHPNDKNAAESFIISNVIFQVFIAIIPRFGPDKAFMSAYALLPMAGNILSLLTLMRPRLPAIKNPRKLYLAAFLVIAVLVTILSIYNVIPRLAGRMLAVVFPWLREVGITTVAEHAVPSWSQIYQDFGMLLVFSLFGAFYSLKRKSLEGYLLGLLWLTSTYAAASLARLSLVQSLPVILAGGMGFLIIVETLLDIMRPPKRLKFKKEAGLSREVVAFSIIIIILLLVPVVVSETTVRYSNQPVLILTSSTAQIDADWLSALEWIRNNVPENSVIATWWDYGYWITVMTRRNTTCDNGTINSTQIRLIARAFLSNETEALKIFKRLKVSYVVVFEPFLGGENTPLQIPNPYSRTLPMLGQYVYTSVALSGYGGDFAKSYQMARWIGWDPNRFQTVTVLRTRSGQVPIIVPADTPEARNATLYRLLFRKTDRRRMFVFEPLDFLGFGKPMPFPGYGPEEGGAPMVRIPPPEHFELVYASEPNQWVLVYKVIYPESFSG